MRSLKVYAVLAMFPSLAVAQSYGNAFSSVCAENEVDCTGVQPRCFPTFDNSCRDGRDCRIAFHQINCCGTILAFGINYLELSRFEPAEQTCESQYPPCGCASQGIFAEDEQQTYEPSDVNVACTSDRTCKTSINPGVATRSETKEELQ